MNGSADIGDIISKLTENPDMMKNLMGMANSLMGNNLPDRKREEDFDRCNDKVVLEKCDKPICNNKANDAENLIRLLSALKPFVSEERCSKIESVIKILKLIQLSEKTGLLKSLI